MKQNYTAFCNEQAQKLFQIINDHEGLLKWKKTWNVEGCLKLPRNINGFYQGVNLWSLLFSQVKDGFMSESWLTFNQIKQKNGYVLKGAKGQKVCFFKMKEVESTETKNKKDPKLKPVIKWYTVFNL